MEARRERDAWAVEVRFGGVPEAGGKAEAQWLMSQEARGLLSPSAALPGSINLTLFGPRVEVPWGTTIQLASSIPTQKLTTGHPFGGLTKRVRCFGQLEPLLQTYLQGADRRDSETGN